MGKNPCRKNTVSEKTLHGRHREVYPSKLCKCLIFKQFGNIKFPKKDSKFFRVGCYFLHTKRKEPKEKYIFSLLYFFNALQVELVVGKKRLG